MLKYQPNLLQSLVSTSDTDPSAKRVAGFTCCWDAIVSSWLVDASCCAEGGGEGRGEGRERGEEERRERE